MTEETKIMFTILSIIIVDKLSDDEIMEIMDTGPFSYVEDLFNTGFMCDDRKVVLADEIYEIYSESDTAIQEAYKSIFMREFINAVTEKIIHRSRKILGGLND